MQCVRCDSNMLRTKHTEHEDVGDYYVITRVYYHECQSCNLSVTVRSPVLYQKEES